MFKSLSIERFRGIREGTVPDLKQVSLFVGPNNSGKSTVLDALLLASHGLSPQDTLGRDKLGVLMERHSMPTGAGDASTLPLWHAYKRDHDIVVKADFVRGAPLTFLLSSEGGSWIGFEAGNNQVYALVYKGLRPSPGNAYLFPRVVHGGRSAPQVTALPPSLEGSMRSVSFIRDAILVDADFRRKALVEQRLWDRLTIDRRDKLLTQMLREVYGMEVENLTYTPSMNGNELVILLPKGRVRVDDLGDGARYFVRMLMVLSLLNDTTLLLEEPETAHHCRAQADITRWIVRTAKERNIQVLATTHSLEAVDHFLAACTEHSVEFGLHHTELKDGVLTCRGVDRNDARVLMDMGVDPRCAA